MVEKCLAVPILAVLAFFYPPFSGGEQGSVSLERMARGKMHHTGDGRFFNPWCECSRRSTFDFLKWRFSKNPHEEEKKKEVRFNAVRPDFPSLDKKGSDYAVWLGHATVLIKAGSKTIITDPVFWDISVLIKTIKRVTPLPVAPEELPLIDYVLISHGHYDHLDTRSVKFLKERFDPFFITGPGYESYLASLGVSKHIVLDWWDGYRVGDIEIRALPAQHWSKRGLFDADRMLWSSFLIEHDGRKYYWLGDSGYFSGFKEIGEKFGPMDVLFVPIGAYEPRWFMETYHMNPEEAMKVAEDVVAKAFVPIHWGTFDLTDEPLWQPIERLKRAYREGQGPSLRLIEHGGVLHLK